MFKRAFPAFLATLIISVVLPTFAFASSDLFFTPARGSYLVDEPMSVRLVVKSTEKLSAIEASVEFDPKMLGVEIVNTSKNVSWVVNPSVDYDRGLITFSGLFSKESELLDELLVLSVIPLRPGSPELRFLSGASTVASDGTGGNTLGKITHAVFDILVQDGSLGESNNNGEVLGASDSDFLISSPDILDESAWYSLKKIILNWTLPSEVNDILVGLTKKPEDLGYKSISNGRTTREINDIEDGEWYFHVTPKGKGLPETKHFRVAIDTEAPIISTTTEKARLDSKDPNIKFNIEAIDKLSGISHFEMLINGGVSTVWQNDGSNEYAFRASGPGGYNLTIAAFDKANNRSEAHANFKVDPLPSPLIKLKRNTVPEASPIIAEIKGLSGASVVVTFEGGVVRHEDTISLDENGKANYILKESILPGNYRLSAIQKIESGASSINDSYSEIEVRASIIGYLGRNLAVSIALIPVIILLIVYLLWRFGVVTWYYKKKLDKRVIQKVAPLSLMPKRNESNDVKYNQIETQPLLIKRVVKTQGPNSVIDLRRR